MGWSIKKKHTQPWEAMPRWGQHHMAWENKASRLPEPGAQAYAYESYGLVEFSPIGPSVAVTTPLQKYSPPYVTGMAVWLSGIPTQAGGVTLQALIDPSAPGGYVSGMGNPAPLTGPNGSPSYAAINDPYAAPNQP